MNGKTARKLRKEAEEETVGLDKQTTRKLYRKKKKNYRTKT